MYTGDIWIEADSAIHNTKTDRLEAVGNVFYQNLVDGQKLSCDRAEYDLAAETGTFYNVIGSTPARIEAKPGLLTTSNPFYFRGEKAQKVKNRYIVQNGFITDCNPLSLWWRLKASTFDVIPHDRAIAHHSTLYIKKIPVFYFPAFYKSLEPQPRRSGFLMPSFGNSSQRGQFLGGGYFWAINRSYDVTYRAQYFTRRGFVHEANFEGWVNSRTNFSVVALGAGEYNYETCYTLAIGQETCIPSVRPSGYILSANARTFLNRGWEGQLELRELSNLAFRQEFTMNFDEAILSETHTVGYLTKHWKDYGFTVNGQHNVNYQTTAPGNKIVIRKLPEAQFVVREHAIKDWPVWISLDSNVGLNQRTQPQFQTAEFVPRLDFAPRVTTSAHWLGLDLTPSFGIRETYYGSRFETVVNQVAVVERSLTRSARDFQFDLGLPRISRAFQSPQWLQRLNAGDKIKHVAEARVRYRYVTGINDFRDTLRFDWADVISNTHEVEFSLTNRLMRRNPLGGGDDVLTWQVFYKRFLDPTFGGAVVPGQRNIVESSDLLTGYAFLYGPRRQSPVVSILRLQTRVGIEWRADYDPDPLFKKFVNSTLTVDARFGKLAVMASHSRLRTLDFLAPEANQVRGQVLYGSGTQRGWNYGFATGYDYLVKNFQFMSAQATYNTDCCGFSVQYRRNNFVALNDNQFRLAFTLANIGSFGTLGRQQRIF